ncbi:hypothetical protein MTR72_24635 [Bradyrhizobium sp. ISRA442]|uniref:hypothetical protein n=1 Tax=Bradyrhizobium sp. ISRA442 TaxID=2866197 RepID=UPI00311AC91E
MREVFAILIARANASTDMANARRLQRIDERDGSGPARGDRRQDLHHQREHDDGKKQF